MAASKKNVGVKKSEPKKTAPKVNKPNYGFTLYALVPLAFVIIGIILKTMADWNLSTGNFGNVIGLLLIFAGIAIVIMAVLEIRKINSGLDITVSGFKLVTAGVYNMSRNPVCLGMLIISVGFGFSLNNVWVLLLQIASWFVLNNYFIKNEEAFFQARYGSSYADYCEKVRRWI